MTIGYLILAVENATMIPVSKVSMKRSKLIAVETVVSVKILRVANTNY